MGTGNWSEKRRWSGTRPLGGTAQRVLLCVLALAWPQAASGEDPLLPEPPGALSALSTPAGNTATVSEAPAHPLRNRMTRRL